MGELGTEGVRTLPAPRLVLVPPPARKRRKLWVIILVSLACGSFLAAAIYFGARRDATLACVLMSFVLLSSLLTGFLIFLQRFERGRRAKFLRAHRHAVRDPISQAMQLVWKPGGPPSIRRVKRELARRGIEEPDTTLVISFGASPTCEIGEHRFEPVVRRRKVVGWFGVVMCVQFGVLLAPFIYAASVKPVGAPIPIGLIWQFLFIGGLFTLSLLATLWEILCPSYTRIAPRYMDFVRFAMSSKPTSIRRFPLQAGTIVILRPHGIYRMRIESAAFATWVSFAALGNSRESNDAMWKCLLSTAASPPLSDEELSG